MVAKTLYSGQYATVPGQYRRNLKSTFRGQKSSRMLAGRRTAKKVSGSYGRSGATGLHSQVNLTWVFLNQHYERFA